MRSACASVATQQTTIYPSGLCGTSGLAEQLRQAPIFGKLINILKRLEKYFFRDKTFFVFQDRKLFQHGICLKQNFMKPHKILTHWAHSDNCFTDPIFSEGFDLTYGHFFLRRRTIRQLISSDPKAEILPHAQRPNCWTQDNQYSGRYIKTHRASTKDKQNILYCSQRYE